MPPPPSHPQKIKNTMIKSSKNRGGLSQQEINAFHLIDRELYTIMVLQLHLNPVVSMHILALLLWLERKLHVSYIVKNILKELKDNGLDVISKIIHEAAACLNCIMMNDLPPITDYNIGWIQHVSNRPISLQFFCVNREIARVEIGRIVNTVCEVVLTDINQAIIQQTAAVPAVVPCAVPAAVLATVPAAVPRNAGKKPVRATGQKQKQSWPKGRTLFMTFSKGYPLEEWEVEEFLAKKFGNMVVSFHMQEPKPGQDQPLHAHIVLRSSSALMQILGKNSENTVLKFSIRSKDARMRKFKERTKL